MATQGVTTASPMNVALDIRRRKMNGQQKKEALEREVFMLEKMLKQEETMHGILEGLQKKKDISASGIPIPNFLPPKMKELLAELAMVEGEIARLEGQISQLQQGLKQEQEITKDTKPKQFQTAAGTLSNLQTQSSKTSNPSPAIVTSFHEKMAFDTKALHFINKAIKGDYHLKNFNINDKMGASKVVISDQKENHSHEETKFQDRVLPKKSGMLKSPSPLRDFRYSSPKPGDRNAQIPSDFLSKSLSNSILSEENIQQMQPNRLSENILKCLNLIYIRLLRTSRAMELEKSGPISRSLHSSMISRSFRVETSTNSKSNLLLQKESRQQDPYGVFNVEESIPRDIGPYKNLVVFTSNSMDPKWISHPSSIPLLKKLRVLMNNLQTVDLRFLTRQQKLAFWINMYNACIMHASAAVKDIVYACMVAGLMKYKQLGKHQGFIQYGVPSAPEKFFTLLNKATLNIGGNTINAQAIEQYILRKPTSPKKVNPKNEKDDTEAIVRKLYGLKSMDPNVTFALCCGTRSSPAVRAYTSDGVMAELERAKLEYLQASVVVTSTKKIAFPDLLLRNTLDFAMDSDTLVEWVCHQLPTSGTLRKSIVDCFRGHNSGKIPNITVEKIPYDFEFQYLLAM